MNRYKKGQVTIFIIIAIILVAAVGLFLIFRGSLFQGTIPKNIEPVYNSFLTCVEEKVSIGADILETQAGYIQLPEFEAGSSYMPFSSQLNFLGNPVPYWYYVSGNNIQKEQVPSKSDMEEQLENFVEDKINRCRFDSYYSQGFEINWGEPNARISINDEEIKLNLIMDFNVKKEEDSVSLRSHKITVNSKLGKLYDSAKKVYETEQKDLFLENYGVDTLTLYAPVDGVELTCSPQIWNSENVFTELQDALESNTLALKNFGDDNDYFKVDLDVKENVRFINSKNWAYSFDVEPSDGSLLIATPVGNQPGLGVLGFCYVPYHFVYNVKYPVLVQIEDPESGEIFQFPLAVVIQGNQPREALEGTSSQISLPELCEYKTTLMTINTYDSNLNRIDSEISYECFGTKCNIGETSQGHLNENFPQCANGYVLARADGYRESKYLLSTISSGTIDIIMDRIYRKNIELNVDGIRSNKNAVITFTSDDYSRTISYPEQNTIDLIEGQYEIQVQVYDSASLKIDATTTRQCVEVPQSGLMGIFGATKEECFDIEIPAQIISNALSGGGTQNHYILESELRNSNPISINVPGLSSPKTLEELQDNYAFVEGNGLEVTL